jgi:hypothetical protein
MTFLRTTMLLASLTAAAVCGDTGARAQPAPATPAPPATPREAAPIDLTGQWVAIVNEDWRWRMVTPPKGDYASVPLNDEGRRVADEWDPAQDGACEAYGAAALLRMPTRLRIRWQGDDRLVLETDAGRQTRELNFAPVPAGAPRSLQGQSTAKWVTPPRPAGGPGLAGAGGGAALTGGYLDVRTTNLAGGWLRRNGVPYSQDAVLTEYFARFAAPNGDEWLMVTTIVDDPRYLAQRFIVSNHFRREAEGGRWNPRPCGEAS